MSWWWPWAREAPVRRRLPNKRRGETFKFEHSNFKWHATIGRYANGDIGEIFLSTSKTGTCAGFGWGSIYTIGACLRFGNHGCGEEAGAIDAQWWWQAEGW
jgi:hypothetical protein